MWRESYGIETEGGVAAAVEERDERLIAEAHGDQRGFVGVVKGDGGAGDEGVASGGCEHDAVARVVEREEGLAEKREAKKAAIEDIKGMPKVLEGLTRKATQRMTAKG